MIDTVTTVGDFVFFLASALLYSVTPPYKPRLLIRQLRIIGADSFFLIALIGLFTGMVLGLQGYNTLSRFGSRALSARSSRWCWCVSWVRCWPH